MHLPSTTPLPLLSLVDFMLAFEPVQCSAAFWPSLLYRKQYPNIDVLIHALTKDLTGRNNCYFASDSHQLHHSLILPTSILYNAFYASPANDACLLLRIQEHQWKYV